MDQVLKLGWEEWVGLPQLGLPALKAKVDTGARTSALHAFDIKLFAPATKPKVRFLINPIPARPDLAIACSATIHDCRDVTSSNGDTEARYVILSPLEIGPLRQEIEITLTDRAQTRAAHCRSEPRTKLYYTKIAGRGRGARPCR